jgi:clan AA aspartic protease
MIEGQVNTVLEPMIEIGLCGNSRETVIAAMVDTGFGGHVCLSDQHLDHVDLTFKFVERYELANGEVIVMDVFRGTIVFDQVQRDVDIITTASADTLVGASLLQAHKLTIDYVGSTVRIQ